MLRRNLNHQTSILAVFAWLILSSSSAFAFAESFTCHITGYVFTAPGDTPDFQRSDQCLWVHDQMYDDGMLILQSKEWVVMIEIPLTIGNQKFWYRWGSTSAHLNGESLRARAYLLFSA